MIGLLFWGRVLLGVLSMMVFLTASCSWVSWTWFSLATTPPLMWPTNSCVKMATTKRKAVVFFRGSIISCFCGHKKDWDTRKICLLRLLLLKRKKRAWSQLVTRCTLLSFYFWVTWRQTRSPLMFEGKMTTKWEGEWKQDALTQEVTRMSFGKKKG